MNKYEKVIITYDNPFHDWEDESSENTITKVFKNATFMFDANYTTIVTKRDSFTVATKSVITIECKESLDD